MTKHANFFYTARVHCRRYYPLVSLPSALHRTYISPPAPHPYAFYHIPFSSSSVLLYTELSCVSFLPKTSIGVGFTVDDIEVHLCQLRTITDPEVGPTHWLVTDMWILPLSPIEGGSLFVIRDKIDRTVFGHYVCY